MNSYLVFVFVAVAFPFAAASYGNSQFGGYGSAQNNYFQSNGGGGGGGNGGVEELLNVGGGGSQHNGGGSLTAAADVAASPSAQAGFAQANAQLHALSVNPSFQNLKNSESISEKLSENHLALNIQQGNINVVPPNVVGQTAFRTLLVPNAMNNHQVIATQPLQPIVVNQPGSPPAHVNSGPPAVVRAAPIVYKLKPSVIYQQEIINKVPAPLSLNPVYVKVYKSGKQVDAPVSSSSYSSGGDSYGNSGGASVNGNGAGYETSQYENAAQPAVYGGQSGY